MDQRTAPTATEHPDFLSGGGEMGALMREFDWALSPLGPADRWPQALRTVVRLMLSTNHPMFIFWGAEHLCFYNDAYKASIGPEKHPAMLGARGREMWDEIWHIIGPQIEQVMAGRGATWHEDHLVPIIRNGALQDVYWTYGYSPIDHAGGVGGVLVLCTETTERVLAERRRVAELDRLRELFQQAPSFVTVLTGPRHRFEFVNDAYQRLIGARDVVGQTVAEALPEVVEQGFIDLLDAVYRTGQSFIGRRTQLFLQRSNDGPLEECFVDFIYKAIRDAAGTVTGIFVEGYDVTEQTRAEEALRQSEERYRGVIDSQAELVCRFEVGGRILLANAAYARSLGKPADELINANLWDFIPAGDRDSVREQLAQLTPDHPEVRIENRFLTKDGERWTLWTNRAIRFDETGALLEAQSTGIDITERKAADSLLRASEARLRALADAMPQLVWTADGAGEVDYFNVRVTEYDGFEKDGAGRWSWGANVHPDDLDATAAAWTKALTTGKTYSFEHRLRDSRGRWRWHISRAEPAFDDTGAVVKWYGTATDIHELKEAETRLQDLNDTLEKRIEATLAERKVLADIVESTDAFVQVADLDYRWIAINKASADEFERIYGVRPRVGDNMLELLGDRPEHREAVRAVWSRALAGEEFTEIGAFGDPGIDRRAYEMKFNALRDRDGKRIGAYQFVYDVTQRLADQERLAEAQEALRQAQKMEAVGQLTGGVAHDFNNLLMAISGGLRMLDQPGDLERHQRIKEGVYRAVERGAGLTRQLLAFSRRRPLEARPLALGEHVAGMRELLERTLRGDVHVEMNLPAKLWVVEVDPGELELAILNLCVNARDAMPAGGVITIEAENVTLTHGPLTGKAVRLTVRDPGIGMDEQTLARVFEPFFTTKDVGKGSGLGLAQVYAFMTQSKGGVEIASKPGKGTSVSLVFPRTRKPVPQPAAVMAEEVLEAPGATLRILLVEDDHEVGTMTAEMLSSLGHSVIHTTSPAQALELFATEQIELVLSDVMMAGGMSGLDLGREIKRRHPGVPVILATGLAESAEGAEAEGFDLLLKPYELAALQRTLSASARAAFSLRDKR